MFWSYRQMLDNLQISALRYSFEQQVTFTCSDYTVTMVPKALHM